MRKWIVVLIIAGCVGCGRQSGMPLDPDFARFVVAKRVQAKELADLQTNMVPAKVWRFFGAVERNDWHAATNLYEDLKWSWWFDKGPPSGRPALAEAWDDFQRRLGVGQEGRAALQTEARQPMVEIAGTYRVFHDWDAKWLRRFSHDIIDSIPPGSIYFGGTDAGRFAISAFSASHREGRPFFTVSQTALADDTYQDYLRGMYGQLKLPSQADAQQIWTDYLKLDQLNSLHGLLAKFIVDKNPTRQIYVEESFPLDWMYPHLEPHGLIMKLHREPLSGLSEEQVKRDHDYWRKYAGELIGDWINDQTSVAAICEFSEKVHLRKNLTGFQGDVGFAQNEAAQKAFSKLRSSIGGLYAWRADQAKLPAEKQRMLEEADLAFRQALALCPDSPEAVFRYVKLLLGQKRTDDALLIAQTASKLAPKNESFRDLLERMQRWQRSNSRNEMNEI